MELRAWIKGAFGTADKKTLLDESVYSNAEIREDKIRLKKERKQLKKEMGQLQHEYQELLEKGANSSEVDRKQYAQQAKIAKKKYQVKQQKYQKNSVQMATIVSIEGARELMEMTNEDTTHISEVMDQDVDHGRVQEHLMDQMVQYELDMDMMLEIQDTLDIDIIGADVDMGGGEEEEIMQQIAEGKTESEKVSIEDDEADVEDPYDVDDPLDDDIGGSISGPNL
ncbi:hypothetical protein [Salinigranum halophilum]|uniref:hypothetical protein n=1 Tax=Salinigranum halophilum TaxID=2565931 RepID=UPI00115DDAE4|nr:hypothetical protein [Salinigranum halophilum]